jgi:hypothetical protein
VLVFLGDGWLLDSQKDWRLLYGSYRGPVKLQIDCHRGQDCQAGGCHLVSSRGLRGRCLVVFPVTTCLRFPLHKPRSLEGRGGLGHMERKGLLLPDKYASPFLWRVHVDWPRGK